MEADARSSLGLGVGVRGTHLAYIYMLGVAADVSSQPTLPISKNNLGRLDTRLLRALHEIPLSAFLNAHHSVLTKANQHMEGTDTYSMCPWQRTWQVEDVAWPDVNDDLLLETVKVSMRVGGPSNSACATCNT